MLGGGEAEGLVGLGHKVADVDAGGAGGGEGFRDAADEQIGDERGVERAGAEGDEVGGGDGFESSGERFGVGGSSMSSRMRWRLAVMLVSPRTSGAVVHAGGQGDVGGGGGVDAAAGGENLRGQLHGLGEVAGDVGERGDEEVAEVVAFEVALREAVLEETGEEMLVFGERDHAVADVAGGEHVEVFAEAAGGAAVVGDGDDGGEVGDERAWRRAGPRRAERVGRAA